MAEFESFVRVFWAGANSSGFLCVFVYRYSYLYFVKYGLRLRHLLHFLPYHFLIPYLLVRRHFQLRFLELLPLLYFLYVCWSVVTLVRLRLDVVVHEKFIYHCLRLFLHLIHTLWALTIFQYTIFLVDEHGYALLQQLG